MRFIRLDSNNVVIATRTGASIVAEELKSDTGELGQILQPDGTFITPTPIPTIPQPTVEDRLTNIEDTQDLILLKLEGVIV